AFGARDLRARASPAGHDDVVRHVGKVGCYSPVGCRRSRSKRGRTSVSGWLEEGTNGTSASTPSAAIRESVREGEAKEVGERVEGHAQWRASCRQAARLCVQPVLHGGRADPGVQAEKHAVLGQESQEHLAYAPTG